MLSKKIAVRKNSAKAGRNLQIFANFAPPSAATVDGMLRPPHHAPDTSKSPPSAAAIWPPLRRFISGEYRLGRVMARRRWTSALYEFLRFGVKQGWACLFGGIAVSPDDRDAGGSIRRTRRWRATISCSSARVAVQAALLAVRLETSDEAKVILIYHLVGTAMEIFKTRSARGSTRSRISSASAACRCSPASCMPASAAISAARGGCSISNSRITRRLRPGRAQRRDLRQFLRAPLHARPALAAVRRGRRAVRAHPRLFQGLAHAAAAMPLLLGLVAGRALHLVRGEHRHATPEPGSIRPARTAGRWSRSPSSARGSCC